MTWYSDLGPICMAGHGDDVRAIGWLSRSQPYPTGTRSVAFIEKLQSHVSSASQPFSIMGFHECDLDRSDVSSGSGLHQEPVREHRNLFVPTVDCVYIAPAMVLHYVTKHRYRPPDEFIVALEQCPPQGSPDFIALMARFRDPFDLLMFDRHWEVKREAAHRRSQQWVRRGMCPRCQFWRYLHEGDVPEHCGVPLVHVEERDPAELRKWRDLNSC